MRQVSQAERLFIVFQIEKLAALDALYIKLQFQVYPVTLSILFNTPFNQKGRG